MISKPRNSGWGSNSFCLIYFLSNLSLVLVDLLLYLLLPFFFFFFFFGFLVCIYILWFKPTHAQEINIKKQIWARRFDTPETQENHVKERRNKI